MTAVYNPDTFTWSDRNPEGTSPFDMIGFEPARRGSPVPAGWSMVLDQWMWTGGGEAPVNTPWDGSNATIMGKSVKASDLYAEFEGLPENEKAFYRAHGIDPVSFYMANGAGIGAGNVANVLEWQRRNEENARNNSGMDFGDFLVMGLAAGVGGLALSGAGVFGAEAIGASVSDGAFALDAGEGLIGGISGGAGSAGGAITTTETATGGLLASIKSAKDVYSAASTISKLTGGADTKGLAAPVYRGGSVPQNSAVDPVAVGLVDPALPVARKGSPAASVVADSAPMIDSTALALMGLIAFGGFLFWSKK